MLHKEQITKGRNDLARIESRHIHLFTRKKFGKEPIDHIFAKVGEKVTGVANEKVFGFSEVYDWQISNEPEALSHYMIGMMVGQMASDVTIVNSEIDIFCTIPTGLHIKGVNQRNENEYIVEPVYCKCPFDQDQFVRFKMMKSPQDVKAHFPKYYWRLLDYMDNCKAIDAHLFVYHPLFPSGSQSVELPFNNIMITEDMHFLRQRKAEAEKIYHQTYYEMTKNVLPL
jgi:hypothetical protein